MMHKVLCPIALCLGVLLVSAMPAHAHPLVKPTVFALPVSAFPSHSTLTRSRIERNRLIDADNVLHFGLPFNQEGRITGYFMEAFQGQPSTPHSDTSYLVSMFPTTQQAASAFDAQQYYWNALATENGITAETLPAGTYGDPGSQAFYSVRLPTGANFAELLFQRGSVFVEVFQEVDAARPTAKQLHAFFDIGTRLDVIALGVSAALQGT